MGVAHPTDSWLGVSTRPCEPGPRNQRKEDRLQTRWLVYNLVSLAMPPLPEMTYKPSTYSVELLLLLLWYLTAEF